MFGQLVLGAAAALLATTLGAAGVLVFRKPGSRTYPVIMAFCAGVMAFSAFEMVDESHALTGHDLALTSLIAGMAVFLVLDKLLPHAHMILCGSRMPDARRKVTLLVGTITLHNIPEGLAIASAFATSPSLGWLVAGSIALQDVPEGLVVAAPVACYGVATRRSFLWGAFSGIVEFAAAVAGFLLLQAVSSVTPMALGFSGGAMTYVILSELLPDSMQSENKWLSAAFILAGFAFAYGFGALIGKA